MHIGGRDGLRPAAGRRHARRSRRCARASPSGWHGFRATPSGCPRPAPAGSPGRAGAEDRRFDVRNHILHAAVPRPGGEARSCATGRRSSSRTGSTGHARCGRWCCWRGLPTAAGRSRRRPTTRWSTASARSASSSCCSISTRKAAASRTSILDGPDAPWEVAAPRASGHRQRARSGPSATQRRSALHAALHPREALERSRALVEVLVSSELSASPRTTPQRPDRRDAPLRRCQDEPLGGEVHRARARRLGQRRAARGLHGRSAGADALARRAPARSGGARDGPDEPPRRGRAASRSATASARFSSTCPSRPRRGSERFDTVVRADTAS